jgi:hypothetical protein
MSSMDDASVRIRQAIARDDYWAALKLWECFTDDLREDVEAGRFTAEKMAEVQSLFEWSRVVLQGSRSHLQSAFNRVCGAAAYLPQQPRRGSFHNTF